MYTNGKIWLYGQHTVLSALQNTKRKIYQVLVYAQNYDYVISLLAKNNISNKSLIKIATKHEIESFLPPDSVHQGYALLCSSIVIKDITSLQHDLETTANTLLILDQVTDTRNIGAIIRSAAAFNVYGIIFTKANAPKENGLMAKASAGSIEKINMIEVANLQNTINQLKKLGFWIIGLDTKHNTPLTEIHTFKKIALVLGSEEKGMRELTKKSCDLLVTIPMNFANAESLNISNATAIALYEIHKNSSSN